MLASHSQTGEGRWPVLAHCLGGCNEGGSGNERGLLSREGRAGAEEGVGGDAGVGE